MSNSFVAAPYAQAKLRKRHALGDCLPSSTWQPYLQQQHDYYLALHKNIRPSRAFVDKSDKQITVMSQSEAEASSASDTDEENVSFRPYMALYGDLTLT